VVERRVDDVIDFLREHGVTKINDLKAKFGNEIVEGLKNDDRFIVIKTENAEYLDLKESWEGVFEAIEQQMREKEKEKEEVVRRLEVVTLDQYSNPRENGG
jgi:predicted  nucleic acid-binding Zn-ribbon protein